MEIYRWIYLGKKRKMPLFCVLRSGKNEKYYWHFHVMLERTDYDQILNSEYSVIKLPNRNVHRSIMPGYCYFYFKESDLSEPDIRWKTHEN